MKNSTCYDIFQIAAPELSWAKIEWNTRKTNDDGSFSIDVLLCEDVDENRISGQVFKITNDSIRRGCSLWIDEYRFRRLAKRAMGNFSEARLQAFTRFLDTDGDEGDIDGWAADAVVQYACFGEVVFS
jgi:hypothetical protein